LTTAIASWRVRRTLSLDDKADLACDVRMLAGEVVARFETFSPLTVQSRVLLEYALAPEKLNAVFKRAARTQYEKELLFSTTVEVMADVVLTVRPSVRQAHLARREQIGVSLTALYAKLALTETSTSEALVRHSYEQLRSVVDAMAARAPAWLDGYEVRIIDGNCVAATEHRLAVTRTTSAAPLPGKGLVIYDAGTDLLQDCILCEDGHAQERSLFDRWLAKVTKGELWIADRNFCTAAALFGIHDREAKFLFRQHATNAPWDEAGSRQDLGRIEAGRVFEQAVRLRGPSDRTLLVRRITLVLDTPTRDGETELHILTNLAREELEGRAVAEFYRRRWTIEGAFLRLALDLRSEIDTLGYPPAALFGFAIGLMAYNVVATMKAAIRSEHGVQAAEQLSGYAMAEELSATYRGMLVALPPDVWRQVATWSAQQVGDYLRCLARHVDLVRFKKTVRGPKKPRPARTALADQKHVSTAQLLRTKRGGK
jgi:IS4 transposase